MLRLREDGLIDNDIWENVMANSLVGIGTPQFRAMVATRLGPLRRRLLVSPRVARIATAEDGCRLS